MASTNYILDKKLLLTLLSNTLDIKKYNSGYVQFVTKGVNDPIYYCTKNSEVLSQQLRVNYEIFIHDIYPKLYIHYTK